jgi:hypothetical protein
MNWRILSAYVVGAAVLVLILTNGGEKREISGRARTPEPARQSEPPSLFPNAEMTYDSAFLTGNRAATPQDGARAGSRIGEHPSLPMFAIDPAAQPASGTPTDLNALWPATRAGAFNSPTNLFSTAPQESDAHRPQTESPVFRVLSEANGEPNPAIKKVIPQYLK